MEDSTTVDRVLKLVKAFLNPAGSAFPVLQSLHLGLGTCDDSNASFSAEQIEILRGFKAAGLDVMAWHQSDEHELPLRDEEKRFLKI